MLQLWTPACLVVSLSVPAAQLATMEYDWPRLKTYVSKRRIALGFSKREATRRAEVSSMTWIKVENEAQPIEDRTWAKIDRALNWEVGSVLAVLTGGEPTEIPEPPTMQEQLDALRRRVEILEAQKHN